MQIPSNESLQKGAMPASFPHSTSGTIHTRLMPKFIGWAREGVKKTRMFDLKNTLKTIKLNESTISMMLGALVILAVGFMVVNYVRGRSETAVKTGAPTVTTETGEGAAVSLPTTHKVSQGESLWKISEEYYGSGYSWVEIAKASNLANPNVITVGQELSIPKVEKASQPAAQLEPNIILTQASGESAIDGDSYAVAQGDHLWGIAVRAYGDGYQWVKIWRENGSQIQNPNLIHPGQAFKIPR